MKTSDKVVCVNASPGNRTGSRFVEKGQIYVIAATDADGDLFLVGDPGPFAWYAWRFRKLADIQAENAKTRKSVSRQNEIEQPREALADSACSAWIPCSIRPQAGEDFGCFVHSVDVLFTDGRNQWVGYLQTWEDEEYDPTWNMKGPDGWEVKNVTHWMPLPSLHNADVLAPAGVKTPNP